MAVKVTKSKPTSFIKICSICITDNKSVLFLFPVANTVILTILLILF